MLGMMPHPDRSYLPTHMPDWRKTLLERGSLPEDGNGMVVFREMVRVAKAKGQGAPCQHLATTGSAWRTWRTLSDARVPPGHEAHTTHTRHQHGTPRYGGNVQRPELCLPANRWPVA